VIVFERSKKVKVSARREQERKCVCLLERRSSCKQERERRNLSACARGTNSFKKVLTKSINIHILASFVSLGHLTSIR